MSNPRSFLDKLKEKRNELVRRAAGKAADAALGRTKKAALGAADTVGEAIERAIFGDVEPSKKEEAAPDPFAPLKAKEKAEREAAERAEQAGKAEDEVDAELRELKKRLGK